MSVTDDWRLRGQERFLQGAELVWKHYRPWSATWEHDHCVFCFAKFMDPGFSDGHQHYVDANPDVLTAGYTTTARHRLGAEAQWICENCFVDFAERFEWTVARS
jgi:hypothetical protein